MQHFGWRGVVTLEFGDQPLLMYRLRLPESWITPGVTQAATYPLIVSLRNSINEQFPQPGSNRGTPSGKADALPLGHGGTDAKNVYSIKIDSFRVYYIQGLYVYGIKVQGQCQKSRFSRSQYLQSKCSLQLMYLCPGLLNQCDPHINCIYKQFVSI